MQMHFSIANLTSWFFKSIIPPASEALLLLSCEHLLLKAQPHTATGMAALSLSVVIKSILGIQNQHLFVVVFFQSFKFEHTDQSFFIHDLRMQTNLSLHHKTSNIRTAVCLLL